MIYVFLELLYFFLLLFQLICENELSFVFICGGHIAYIHRVPEDDAETGGGM